VNKLATAVAGALEKNRLGKHLHILVNNAAIANVSGLEETTEEQFDQLFSVNVKSVFFLTQKLAALIPQGGRIVNLSSVVSRAAFPTVLTYSMTKGAIDVMTRSLAAAFGAKGITVNAVAPGNIETDMNIWLKSDEGRAAALGMQSIAEVGQPEHVADAVAFLAGPDGRWVTGQILDASGGSKL
jgi:3-oxoacyl-[acyl-carrier protein] reductase